MTLRFGVVSFEFECIHFICCLQESMRAKVEILWLFDVSSSIAALLVPCFGGIGLFALPAGIITAGFRNEQLRRHPSKHHGNVIFRKCFGVLMTLFGKKHQSSEALRVTKNFLTHPSIIMSLINMYRPSKE